MRAVTPRTASDADLKVPASVSFGNAARDLSVRVGSGHVSYAAMTGTAREALVGRDGERALASLQEAQRIARIGSWTWDTVADEATWSDEMYRIFGRDRADGPATGEEFFAVVHPEDRGRLAEGYAAVFGGGPAFELDYRIIRPDGVEMTLNALGREERDRPGCYAGTVQDVTALRAGERALRASQAELIASREELLASQRELRRQTELMSTMIDNAPIGKAIVGLDGRFRRVNRALCALVAYDEAALLALSFQEITHPDDLHVDREHVHRMLAGEIETYQIEKRYLRSDGGAVWSKLSVSMVRDASGSPEFFITQVEDISAAKDAKQDLLDRERQLAEAQALAHVGSWEWELGAGAPWWSDEMRRILGVPLEVELSIDGFLARIHPDDRAHVAADIEAAKRGVPSEREYRVVRPDGEVRHVHGRRFGRVSSGDVVTHVFGTTQDLTDRTLADQELRRAHEHARAIIAAMGEGYGLTIDGRITEVNEALCRLVGFSREELLGTSAPFRFWAPEALEETMALRERILAERGGSFGLTLMHKDGRRIEAEITAQPAWNPDGTLLGFVNTFRDVSARNRHEAELKRLATHDPLTGLPNHAAFHAGLRADAARSVRHDRPLSLVLLDVDHFKQINDRHGHLVGDSVLREVADRVKRLTREGELFARVGGEEFAWVLPDATGIGAFAAAERARQAISATPFEHAGTVTMSCGVCDLDHAAAVTELYERADQALYWAKANGRNRTYRYTPETARHLDQRAAAGKPRALAAVPSLAELALTADAKHPDFVDHARRVAELARALAANAGWAEEQTEALYEAALVHDIGKIAIPDTIIGKTGPLTESEEAQVRTHPSVGAEMLSAAMSREQVAWVRHHHERWDGTGYPDRLSGEAIPTGAQLIALADTYDAMTHDRPYRRGIPHELALLEIQSQSGGQFAPGVIRLMEVILAGGGRDASGVADSSEALRVSAPRSG